MALDTVSIMIGGEAGQGLVTIGDLLSRCLVRSGRRIVVVQDYMSRIRGGHNTFTIHASNDDIQAAREPLDILVALNEETATIHRDEMAEGGLVLVGADFKKKPDGAIQVPYGDLAEGRYANTAALGVAAALIGLDRDLILKALEKAFGKKHPEAVEKNAEAVNRAYDWCEKNCPDTHRLEDAGEQPQRICINANEAIALGALAAGVRFCAFYPMTPATSVALNLAARAEKMGLVVEQAEDEIAAINMVVGASYAGAPSLVSTSGGGFALMGEAVSLAAMTETPVVIVVVQRPGPATGLPTRTAQGDLELVLYAGHGEFSRAVLAPGTVEQAYELTRAAFDLAELQQGPVFVLNDQYQADSYRAVLPFDVDGPEVNPGKDMPADVAAPYQRYALTDSGVSPRLLPGLTEHLVVADSDEHTPDGHLTEDLEASRLQMNKRMKKIDLLRERVIPPEYQGPENPELLLVCWGSSRGPVFEARRMLEHQGRNAGALHFSQVWPLIPDQFLGRLQRAGRTVAVEGNATGQFANLIRRETGYKIDRLVTRYNGPPLTPAYIVRELEGQGATS